MINFITKESFFARANELDGDHWSEVQNTWRWDYHNRVIELLKSLKIEAPNKVLEMGTMGVTCVLDSQTIDYAEKWDYKDKNPTILYDAREIPWPIEDKKYDVFIALRVFHHLVPKQKEAFVEATRIAKKIIIVVPDSYSHLTSKGITYDDFLGYYDGIHPNLFIPTSSGDIYYWDTEIKSNINLKNVVYKEEIDLNKISLKELILKRIKQKIFKE